MLVVLLLSPASLAANPACGAVLTVNTTLTSDLDCTGYAGTPALTLGASGITLDGGGYKILMTDSGHNYTAVYAKNQKNITIQNLTVDSNGAVSGTGIQIAEDSAGLSQNCSIINVSAKNRVTGIYSACDAQVITNVTATNGSTVNLELSGVGATLTGNTLTGGAIGLYLLSFTGALATSTTTLANAVIGMQLNTVGSSTASTTLDASGLTFSNPYQGVYGTNLTNVTLTKVTDVGPNPGYNSGVNYGINVSGTGVSVTNSSSQGRGYYGVAISAGGGGNTVINNVTASNCTQAGVFVTNSTSTSVTNSTVTASNNGFTLNTIGSALTFTGNTAQGNNIGVNLNTTTGVTLDNLAGSNLVQNSSYAELGASNATNLTISNWNLNGNNPSYNNTSNFLIAVSGSGIAVNTITSTAGGHYNGIWVIGPNSTIENVTLAVPPAGIALQVGTAVNDVIDNNVLGGGATALQINSASDPSNANVTITNNDFRGAITAMSISSTTNLTFDATTAHGSGNLFGSNLYAGISGNTNEHLTIRGVNVSGTLATYNNSNNYGVVINGDYTTIDHVTANSRGYGIQLAGGFNVVSNCVANNNVNDALYLLNSPQGGGAIASGNTLQNNGTAILFYNSYGGTATGNDFTNTNTAIYFNTMTAVTYDDHATPNNFTGTATGIYANYSSGVSISNLTLTGTGLYNGDNGLLLSASNIVVNNVVVTQKNTGMQLTGANPTVTNSSATHGRTGIYLAATTGGALSHVTLSNNTTYGLLLYNTNSGPSIDHLDVSNSAAGVNINTVTNWTFDGKDANGNSLGDTFAGDGTGIYLNGTNSGLVIADLDLSASSPNGYGVQGNLVGSTLRNINASNRSYGVSISGQSGLANDTLTNITADNCLTAGLFLANGLGYTVSGGSARNGTSGLVFGAASAMVVSGIDLTGSVIALTLQSGSSGLTIDNATAGLIFSGNTTGVYLNNAWAVSLSNMNLSLPSGAANYRQGYAILCQYCTQLTLNNVNGNGHNYGAFVAMSGFSPVGSISNSTFDNFNSAGLELAYMSNATVSNVTMKNGNGPGLFFQSYTGGLTMSGVSTSGSLQPISFGNPNSNILIDGAPVGLPANDFSGGTQGGITGSLTLGTIQNVDVSGPSSGGIGNGININGDGLYLSNVTADYRQNGIVVNGNNAQIYNSLVHGNSQYGIQLNGANGLVNNNRICFNASAGFNNASAHTVDATNNYWGTTTGPTVVNNPGGTGDLINGNVTVSPATTPATYYVADIPYSTSGSGCVSNLAARQFALSGVVSAAAGTAQTLTVTALDAFGFVAGSYSGTVHLRSGDGQAVLGGDAKLTNGVGQFAVTLKTAGSQYVVAQDTVTPQLYSQVTVQIAAGAPSSLALISGGGQSAAAGAALPNPFVIAAFDAYGNAAPNTPLSIASTHAGASAAPNSISTAATGLVSSYGTVSTVAGSSNFTVTSSAMNGYSLNIPATSLAGQTTLLTVTGLPSPTLVSGTTSTITVSAFDRYGNATTGYTGPVQFSSTDPRATLPGASALTNGVGAFPVTLRTAGSRTVYVSDVSYPGPSGNISTTVVNGNAAQIVLVSGSGQTPAVASAATAPMVVAVVDAAGNPVSGTNVTFAAATTGGSVGQPATVSTNAAGLAQDTVAVGTIVGVYSFTASSAGLVGSPVVMQANAQAGSAAKLVYISGSNQRGTVGAPLSAAFIVSTTDQYGNGVPNQNVTFAPSAAGTGSVSPSSVTSDGAGFASSVGTLGTTAGAEQFKVTAGFASNVVTYSATAIAGAATQLSYVSGSGQTGAVGSALANPLVVLVSDAYSNPVQGASVLFSASPSSGSANPAIVTSDASGQARSVATLATVAGSNTFSASSSGLTGSPVAISATGTAGPAAQLTVTGLPSPMTAGSTSNVTVTAVDRYGNVATDYTGPINFTSTDTRAALPSSSALTNGTGIFPITLRTAGLRTVTATDASFSTIAGSESTSVASSAAAQLLLASGSGQTATVGTAAAAPLVIQVVDSSGNPVGGTSVTFAAVTGGGSIAAPVTVTSSATGLAQAFATVGTIGGAYTFTATSTGLSGSPVALQVTAQSGAAAKLVYVSGANQNGTAGTALGAPLVVTTTDQYGNRVANQSVTFVAPANSGSASVSPSSVTSDGSGLAQTTATLGTVAGMQQFTATAAFASNTVNYPETANAGVAARISYVTSAAVSGSGQSGVAGSVLAKPLLASISDASGNPVQGVSVSFSALTAGASVNPSVVTSDANGQVQALASLAPVVGANSFNAAVAGLTNSPLTYSETGAAGSGTRLVLSGAPASIAAGTQFVVNATAYDGSGNKVTSFSGPVAFSSTDGAASFPSSPTLSNGAGIFNVVLKSAGTQAIALSDPNNVLASSSALVVVTAATASHIALVSGSGQSGAANSTLVQPLRVQVTDAYANPVAGKAIAFAAESGSIAPSSVPTDSQGFAQAFATLGSNDGATTYTATAPFGSAPTNTITFHEAVLSGTAVRLSVSGIPSPIAAGSASSVTIRALDGSGSVATSFTGNVILSSSDGAALLGIAAPLVQGVGVFAVTLNSVGTQSVTATSQNDSTISGTEGGIVVQAGAPVALVFTPQGSTSYTCGCRDLNLQLVDGAGNRVSNSFGNIQLATGGAAQITQTSLGELQGSLPAQSISGSLASNGSATVTVCDQVVETFQTTASQSALANAATQSLTILTGPLDATQSTLVSSTPTIESLDGVAHLTLTPRDSCGNAIGAGLTGVAMSAPSPAQVTAVVDQGDGTYTAELSATSCLAVGTSIQVTAQVNRILLQAPLTIAVSCAPVSPEKTSVALSATTVVRCDDESRDQVQITVVPRDAAGQPLGGDGAVSLDSAAGALAIGTFTRVGDAFVGSFTAFACSPNPIPVSVFANGVAVGPSDLTVTFTCPAIDPAHSGFQLDKTVLSPDGIAAATVSVIGMTTCGEAAHDREVTLSARLGKLLPATGTTNFAGTFVSQLTSVRSGTDQITGTIDGVTLTPATIKYQLTSARPGGGGCSSSSEPTVLALLGILILAMCRSRRLTLRRPLFHRGPR